MWKKTESYTTNKKVSFIQKLQEQEDKSMKTKMKKMITGAIGDSKCIGINLNGCFLIVCIPKRTYIACHLEVKKKQDVHTPHWIDH